MEAEIFRRAQQIQEVNNRLRIELEVRKRAEDTFQALVRSTLKPIPLDRVQGQGVALKRVTTATVTMRVKTRMTVTMSLSRRGCKRILLSRVLHSWSESTDFLQR